MNCDVCGNSVTMLDGKTVFAVSIVVNNTDSEISEFLAGQLFPYELDRDYRVCWACYLRSLGIIPDGADGGLDEAPPDDPLIVF